MELLFTDNPLLEAAIYVVISAFSFLSLLTLIPWIANKKMTNGKKTLSGAVVFFIFGVLMLKFLLEAFDIIFFLVAK